MTGINDQFRVSVKDVPPGHPDEQTRRLVERIKARLHETAGMSVDNGDEHTYLFNTGSVGEVQIKKIQIYSRLMSNFVTLEKLDAVAA